MSAETITTAIFLITAVVATAVLVNAIYPVIYTTAGTFQSSTHDADTRLRTDFKIIATFAASDTPGVANIYLKNIGSQRISLAEIKSADVFCGAVGDFDRLQRYDSLTTQNGWSYTFTHVEYDINSNDYWDTGETLKITAQSSKIPPPSVSMVYFQFSLPNGIWRSTEFYAAS